MNNALKAFFLFFLLSSFITSCSTGQKVFSSTAKKRSVKFLMRQLEKNRIDYTWMGSRAKIKFNSEKQKASFVAVIRMQKDSLIWIKINKMNVEGFRIKITPERIEVLDRQKSIYTNKPFSFLNDEFGLELSFSELQELVIGNPILYQKQALISVIQNEQNILKTPESQKAILKIFMNPASFLVNEIRGSMNNNSLQIKYDDYLEIKTQQIPMKKEVEVDSEDIGIVDLKITFSKMILNEVQKVKFIVPDSYAHP